MTKTWNDLAPADVTGVYESQPINLSYASTTTRAIVLWEHIQPELSLPATASVLFQTSFSKDGGATWSPWTAITPNPDGDIAGYSRLSRDLENGRLRVRLTFNRSGTIESPVIRNIRVDIRCALPEEGTWTSPLFDFKAFLPSSTNLRWNVNVPVGRTPESLTPANWGTIRAFWRVGADPNHMQSWIEVPASDVPFPKRELYCQFRWVFTPAASRSEGPSVLGLHLKADYISQRGMWESNVTDVSKARDVSTGKVSSAFLSSGGDILQIHSRSRAAEGSPWSPWTLVDITGKMLDGGNKFFQLRAFFTGGGSRLQELTAFFDGEASTTLLNSGLAPNAPYQFAVLRDRLLIANGVNRLLRWDGETPSADTVETAPILSRVVTHQNRLWGVEAENRSRVRRSDILNTEIWEAFAFIDFNPEDGDFITALYRYGQNLVVSKRRSMALLTGNSSANYSVVWLEGNIGATGPRALASADKFLAFVANDGIRFSDLSSAILATERLRPTWDEDINQRRLEQAAIVHWRNNLLVALPKRGSLVNNTVWAFDFLRNSWKIYHGWDVSAWAVFHQYGEDILLAADSRTGQVYRVMVTRADDGVPVQYRWRSKDFHFGHPERLKLFRGIHLDIDGVDSDTTLEVDMIVDRKHAGTYRTVIPAGTGEGHSRRILPPLYNAVLGRTLTLEFRGRCGIKGFSMEYIVKGVIPGGDL